MLPCASQATGTTRSRTWWRSRVRPVGARGMRHTLRCPSPGSRGRRGPPGARRTPLRAGVRLERDRGEAGDLGEPGFQVAEEPPVAAGLLLGGKRVEPRELRPRNGEELARRVELHRAGAERDHRLPERQVLGLEPFDVAQHLMLGVVPLEDRRRQERACPGVGRVEAVLGGVRGGRGALRRSRGAPAPPRALSSRRARFRPGSRRSCAG